MRIRNKSKRKKKKNDIAPGNINRAKMKRRKVEERTKMSPKKKKKTHYREGSVVLG